VHAHALAETLVDVLVPAVERDPARINSGSACSMGRGCAC